MIITGYFERFQYSNFETNFLKNENLFQKTGLLFLVESTKIEKAIVAYKTSLSDSNVKINRIGSKNGLITKNGILSVTALFFENFISA